MVPVLATFLWQNAMNKVTYTGKHLFGCVVLEGQESTIEQRHGPWNWKTQQLISWTTSSLQEANKGDTALLQCHTSGHVSLSSTSSRAASIHTYESVGDLSFSTPLAPVYLIVSGSVSPWVLMDSHLSSHFLEKSTGFLVVILCELVGDFPVRFSFVVLLESAHTSRDFTLFLVRAVLIP